MTGPAPATDTAGGRGVQPADRQPADPEPADARPVVLFDGVCNLCSGFVQFVVRRDPRGRFRFAAIQSPAGRRLLAAAGIAAPPPGQDPATLVLVEPATRRAHVRSGAALRIARRLRQPWPLCAVFLLVPRPLRDLVYEFIARRRYRWWGRSESCMVPTPALRERFVAD